MAMEGWVEREIEACEFPDERLKTRFGKLLCHLGEKIGAALPAACQDWAATKAAYRFFSNPRVHESIILAGHFAATKSRIAVAKGPILVLHATTEFSFQRERPETIGKTRVLPSARIGAQPPGGNRRRQPQHRPPESSNRIDASFAGKSVTTAATNAAGA
jgi:hypothetical protein